VLKTAQYEVRFVKFILRLGAFLGPMISIPHFTMQWLMRCSPITFGYFLIPECHNGVETSPLSSLSYLKLTLLCFLAFWFVTDAAGSWAIFVGPFSITQAYCLRRYTHFITCLVGKRPEKCCQYLQYYRQVQVLSRYYNRLQQDKLITVVLFLMTLHIITGFYALIFIGIQSISIPELLLFVDVSLNAIVCMTVYTNIVGQLYVKSKHVGKKLKGQVLSSIMERKQIRWVERYVKSLWPVKCYIGYNNFVDELTPLNLLSFCASQIVSLLMLH